MNVTTRKRRSRKGVKWINHFYSDWFKVRLSLGEVVAFIAERQGRAMLDQIKATKTTDSFSKKEKAAAIARCIINTNVAVMKARTTFID